MGICNHSAIRVLVRSGTDVMQEAVGHSGSSIRFSVGLRSGHSSCLTWNLTKCLDSSLSVQQHCHAKV